MYEFIAIAMMLTGGGIVAGSFAVRDPLGQRLAGGGALIATAALLFV